SMEAVWKSPRGRRERSRMGSVDPSRIKLPSQRSTHSATSRSVAAGAATVKKRKATMSWRISCYSTGTSGAAEETAGAEGEFSCLTGWFCWFWRVGLCGGRGAIFGPPFSRFSRRRTAVPATTPMAWPRRTGCLFPKPTRLHFPEADADADKITAFGNSLVVLVDRQNLEASLLLRKPTARMPHTAGERIKQNSPDEAVLKAWIARLAHLSGVELATALK